MISFNKLYKTAVDAIFRFRQSRLRSSIAESQRLIVGEDIVNSGEIKKWKNYDEIEKLAKLIVLPRTKFKYH